mgnify:CR=1 FL=1
MSHKDAEREIAEILNKHSMEIGSDTPDFIIAAFLLKCLEAVELFSKEREEWKRRDTAPKALFSQGEFPKVQRLIDYASKRAEGASGVAGGLVYSEYTKVIREAKEELAAKTGESK